MLTKSTLELREKQMSKSLKGLINKMTKSMIGVGQLWEQIKEQGRSEGFAEKELVKIIRKHLREKLALTKDKIYYFFHSEDVKSKRKDHYEKYEKSRNVTIFPSSIGNDLPALTTNNDIESTKAGMIPASTESTDITYTTTNPITFDPKHFNPKNINYYDLAYLRVAVLYYHERCTK